MTELTKILHLNNGKVFNFIGEAAEKVDEKFLMTNDGSLSFESEGIWYHIPNWAISYVEVLDK